MSFARTQLDTEVSEHKIVRAVEQNVEAADPVRIVAFGSRAKGDLRPKSDLDLAVIVDHLVPGARPPVTRSTPHDIAMSIDLLVLDSARHEQSRAWRGSVHQEIEQHGLVLYNRENGQQTDRRAIARLVGR